MDIYSLGIILFEMFYKCMPTLMERVAVLTEIRKPKIAFPKDWDSVKLKNQSGLICSLLQHDPSGRPSASVCGLYLSFIVMLISKLHEFILILICQQICIQPAHYTPMKKLPCASAFSMAILKSCNNFIF